MKKTNKIFNVFLLTTLAFVVLGVVFSTLALFLTYTEFKGNIKVNSVYSILFIVFAFYNKSYAVFFVQLVNGRFKRSEYLKINVGEVLGKKIFDLFKRLICGSKCVAFVI